MTISFLVPFADYPSLVARGLQVLEVRSLGEPPLVEVLAYVPEALMQELQPKKQSKLTLLLSDLFAKAQAAPGQPQRASLPGGMGLDLIAGLDGMFRLQIWRAGAKPPSDIEWRTTLAHLPLALPYQNPDAFTSKGRRYLRTAWPIPTKVNP